MIVFKTISLIGLFIALGSNCYGQKSDKDEQRKRNEQPNPKYPYSFNLYQKAYSFNKITDEAITGITEGRNEEISTNADTSEVTQTRPMQLNTKTLEKAVKKTDSGVKNKVSKTKKLNKQQLSSLDKKTSDVLRKMGKEKMKKVKDEKNEEEIECINYTCECIDVRQPLIFILLAIFFNYLSRTIDKYDKEREREDQENTDKQILG